MVKIYSLVVVIYVLVVVVVMIHLQVVVVVICILVGMCSDKVRIWIPSLLTKRPQYLVGSYTRSYYLVPPMLKAVPQGNVLTPQQFSSLISNIDADTTHSL